MKGFVLVLSLMLILILSIFAYWMLLISQAHYAASRALFESDNARILSDAALQYMVQLHNHQQPRLFTDPARWNSSQLRPFSWNGYQISGSLSNAWNPIQANVLTLRADKGRYASEIQAPLKQLRLEDFALFSNTSQTLQTSTLFEGKVYSSAGLTLSKPCRFRDLVFNEVNPKFDASYRRKSEVYLDFPALTELFPAGWNSGSVMISAKNPTFWQTDHYVLDLDALDISAIGKRWRIFYQGKSLGDVQLPGISFDQRLEIRQSYREIPWLGSGNVEQSFYVLSAGDITFKSSLQTLQLGTYALRFCFVSTKNILVQPDFNAARIEATLVAFGDLFADAGSTVIDAAQKQSWVNEIQRSTFIVEPTMKDDFMSALNGAPKILWLRGTTAVKGGLHIADDLVQLHFEATRKNHSSLGSFPYVEIVEGGEQWQ